MKQGTLTTLNICKLKCNEAIDIGVGDSGRAFNEIEYLNRWDKIF